jgi:hypothetical protein
LRDNQKHAVSFSVSRTLAHAQPFPRQVANKITQSPSFRAFRFTAALSNPAVAYTFPFSQSIALTFTKAQWTKKLHTGQQVAFKRKELYP